jgi:hypothetical protein
VSQGVSSGLNGGELGLELIPMAIWRSKARWRCVGLVQQSHSMTRRLTRSQKHTTAYSKSCVRCLILCFFFCLRPTRGYEAFFLLFHSLIARFSMESPLFRLSRSPMGLGGSSVVGRVAQKWPVGRAGCGIHRKSWSRQQQRVPIEQLLVSQPWTRTCGLQGYGFCSCRRAYYAAVRP